MVLEEAGAILYKDVSTNKGGVTSSSLEVLAGLAIEDQIFKRHMSCTPNSIPKFYQEYVFVTIFCLLNLILPCLCAGMRRKLRPGLRQMQIWNSNAFGKNMKEQKFHAFA